MREREREIQTHYDIQMERRAGRRRRLEPQPQGHGLRQRRTHGPLAPPKRQLRHADRPGRAMPFARHRHAHDRNRSRGADEHAPPLHTAELFCIEGQGYTVVNDRKVTWSKWDALYIPTNSLALLGEYWRHARALRQHLRTHRSSTSSTWIPSRTSAMLSRRARSSRHAATAPCAPVPRGSSGEYEAHILASGRERATAERLERSSRISKSRRCCSTRRARSSTFLVTSPRASTARASAW